jgi:hypothetical protein
MATDSRESKRRSIEASLSGDDAALVELKEVFVKDETMLEPGRGAGA